MKNECVILIGMPGVGKSTSGKFLADLLGFYFIDLDAEIIKKMGKSTQKIIDEEGEEAFLAIEKQSMGNAIFYHHVIAPGGSIIYISDLMETLKKEVTLVYLQDSCENIEKRERQRGAGGVVGMKFKSFKQIFEEREPLYLQYADITINVSGKSPQEIAKEIYNLLLG